MFAWTPQATDHLALGGPSPLLNHIAGEFAGDIAGLWPAPHAAFLTTDAARRHLLCLRLAQGGGGDLRRVIETILGAAFKTAIAKALVDPPTGLKRALEHMGEIAWPRAAYLGLIGLLRHPQAAKALRHARVVTPEQVAALTALPPALIDAGLCRLGLGLDQARLMAEVFHALQARDGPDEAAALVRRWAGASTAKELIGLAGDAIKPEFPAPAFVGTARLRPLATRQAVLDAGARYRNCLRYQLDRAANGHSCFFEWLPAPGAVVEVTQDNLYGWRLDQARLPDNAAVPEAVRVAICAELRDMGVHLGRSDWEIAEALDNALSPGFAFPPLEAPVAACFTD